MWNLQARKLYLLQEEQSMGWQRQALLQQKEHTCSLQQWHEQVEQAPERHLALLHKYRRETKQWYLDVEHARQIFQDELRAYIFAVADYEQRLKRFRLQAWAKELRLKQSWQRACRRQEDARHVFLEHTFGKTLGRIIAFRRRGYMHYGIGDGRGSVLHFTNDGAIRLEGMADVADKSQRWNVVEDADYGMHLPAGYRRAFPDQEVLSRAMRCLEDRPLREYSLTRYNCEHFVTEMRFGQKVCVQKHHLLRGAEELERTFFGTNYASFFGNTQIGQGLVDGIAGIVGQLADGERILDGIAGLAGEFSAPAAAFSQVPQRQHGR